MMKITGFAARTFLFALALTCAAAVLATPGAAGKHAASACAKKSTTPNVRAATRLCDARLTTSTRSRDTTRPNVSWQAPSSGATVNGKLEGARCLVNASDNRGVAKVVFRVDGTTLNTETDAPWNCTFDSAKVGNGSHTLTAIAYDAAGNSRSASIGVVVANGDLTPPTVAWLAPAEGSTIGGTLEGSACEVSAADDQGVDHVVFAVDGTTINTESDAPWNCTFDTARVVDGTHTVTATAYDAAGNSSSASRTFTVANSLPVASDPAPAHLVIGIDGGYAGWSSTETTYRAQFGAAVTRHEWDVSQPVNAQDALVLKAAATVHTRIHALLGENELGNATHYREWVVAFIRRYGLGGSFWKEHPELDEARYAIQTFELGNEPYFGGMTAAEYADTVRPVLEEVHQLGLPAKMILDSRVYGTDTSWMDTIYAHIPNLNALFYAFADHPYWYGHDPAAGTAAGPFGRIAVLRRRMNEKGAADKPIFISEYGESTANCGEECVTEAVQAQHLKEMIEAAITRPEWKIEMVSVFQLLDRGTGSTDRELQFGLLRQDGTPKPSYSIVRQFAQEYRG
jgi:Big-like domain-containing protein